MALVRQQHDKAKQILTENKDELNRLADFLYEKETITGEEFMQILNAGNGQQDVLADKTPL